MKKYISYFVLALLTYLTSCDDSFLNRLPVDKETESTVFTTYDNFKKYAWRFYNSTNGLISYQSYPYDGDVSDMMYYAMNTQGRWNYKGGFDWVFGTTAPSNISAAAWNFDYIRQVNIMLDNIDGSQMTVEDKEHWRSVGYFFRAHAYFELMKNYGELPWLEHVVATNDGNIIYGKKDSRELVANNILTNLQYAEKHIYTNGDGTNTVNSNVIKAFISRFGLWEGTWRKYHGSVDGIDGTKYFEASVKASQELIDQNLGLVANFDDVFNSESLADEKSILLYRVYVPNEADKGHDLTVRIRGELQFEATKKLVEQYLCNDGRPVSTSPKYDGDASVYDEFRNRDHRLYYTICPPYKVNVPTSLDSWEYTGVPEEQEYIDLMNNLVRTTSKSGENGKIFPLGTTQFIARIPNIQTVSVAGSPTQTGYYFYKYYNSFPGYNLSQRQGTDAPIFRMGEVLVNHAEAMFELGRFNQSVADATINKLRKRVEVADMVVNDINADFDLYRDADVDPVLWEIRRERCSELIGSGFRYHDIKRWKKGTYMNERPVGVKLEDDLARYTEEEVEILKGMRYDGSDKARYKNCATYVEKPNPGWDDKYYLLPIPQKQTVLNENLSQNPGWN
jgi:SusD family.